ncbi:MAG: hypothetical protein K2X03_09050 [Bryobacteraceae bacterium]|nr:hypothetical protein [Bryobacteraceae bacterium]
MAFLLACLASAHTYHASIAQLDFISARKTVEVMLWLHTEDVERAFQAQAGPRANFDEPKAAERFVRDYLQGHFQLRNARGEVLKQHWVGMEVKVHFLTAYFEVALPDGLPGVTLENRLLLDRVPDQTNSAQVKRDGNPLRELQFNAAAGGVKQPLLKP